MVIDTSAIIAIFQDEPERESFLRRISIDGRRLISAATLVETTMVLRRTFNEDGTLRLQRFLDELAIEAVLFDRAQAMVANEAFRLTVKDATRLASTSATASRTPLPNIQVSSYSSKAATSTKPTCISPKPQLQAASVETHNQTQSP